MDIFAAKHSISGDYFLMRGESGDPNELYLLVKGQGVSVAGPLHQIGFSQQYIVFTDQNWPKPWSVIRVGDHSKFSITEVQRANDSAYKQIAILSPSKAWDLKSR